MIKCVLVIFLIFLLVLYGCDGDTRYCDYKIEDAEIIFIHFSDSGMAYTTVQFNDNTTKELLNVRGKLGQNIKVKRCKK